MWAEMCQCHFVMLDAIFMFTRGRTQRKKVQSCSRQKGLIDSYSRIEWLYHIVIWPLAYFLGNKTYLKMIFCIVLYFSTFLAQNSDTFFIFCPILSFFCCSRKYVKYFHMRWPTRKSVKTFSFSQSLLTDDCTCTSNDDGSQTKAFRF